MNPFVFFAQVVAPVLVQVAVADGLGSLESPAGAGDVHAVFDQPSCRSLDDAGGDRPSGGEGGGVVQVFLLGGEVVRAGVGAFAFGWGVPEGGGAAADAGRGGGGLALEDLSGLFSDPGLGVRVAFVEE